MTSHFLDATFSRKVFRRGHLRITFPEKVMWRYSLRITFT